LDNNVGKTVIFSIQRAGEILDFKLDIGDLHAITPDRFVSVAGATVHDLSYQSARRYAISLEDAGVCVSETTSRFLFPSAIGSLIQEVDNQPTPNLDAFIEVMKKIPDKKRVIIQYKHLHDLHTPITSIATIDRHWNTQIWIAVRNDTTGLWDFKPIADPIPSLPAIKQHATFVKMNSNHAKAAGIFCSIVQVVMFLPLEFDGLHGDYKRGSGLVVDSKQGLVIVSREIVPHDFGDVSLVIADSIVIAAEVVFFHPLQNYTVLRYDPLLVAAPVKTPELATELINNGDETIFVGLNQSFCPVVAKTVVTDIATLAIPACTDPCYRAMNFDAISVDTSQAAQGSGVLVTEIGTVQALWLPFGERHNHNGQVSIYHFGLATPNFLPVLDKIKSGETPKLRILNVEFLTIKMSQARARGLSEEWIAKTESEDPERHRLLMVRKVDSGHRNGLKEGDILLTLNGKLVTRSPDLDVRHNQNFLEAVIVRKGEEKTINVPTVATQDLATDCLIHFCGATLHRPHQAVRQQITRIHSEVYISSRAYGSPAEQYGVSVPHLHD
jgi:S1-C subfamily serine protease